MSKIEPMIGTVCIAKEKHQQQLVLIIDKCRRSVILDRRTTNIVPMDQYLFLKTDGTTFYGDEIEQIYDAETEKKLKETKFGKFGC